MPSDPGTLGAVSQRQRAQVAERRRRNRTVGGVVAVLAVVALVAVVVLVGTGAEEPTGVAVTMREYRFDPDPIVAPDGVLELTNQGAIAHNLVIPQLGKGSLELTTGQKQVVDLSDQPPGTYRVICDLTGHLEQGMETEITLG